MATDIVTPEITPNADAEPEIEYRYQPTDDEGRPLGGEQVFKGKTQQEILDKVAKANTELIKLNRTMKREQVLKAQPPPDEIPADAERARDFSVKPLTQAEKVQISKDLHDPDKFEAAQRRLNEADPETVAVRRDNYISRLKAELDVFSSKHTEVYQCVENGNALVSWCKERNLAINLSNLELALKKLKEAGLLLEAPIAAEVESRANSQPDTETDGAGLPNTNQEPTKRPVETSSGLTRRQGSSAAAIPARRGLTWADVDKLNDTEWRSKMRDPNFKRQVDALPPR